MKSTKTASQLGFDAPATIISGGELDLRWVELSEENLATISAIVPDTKSFVSRKVTSLWFFELNTTILSLVTSEELRDVNDAFNLCLGV
jgi:hypothetical protein